MKINRIAIIDLGTNTFNLLIVDWEDGFFSEVYGTKIGVGLGLGGINENKISAEAESRGLDALAGFKKTCVAHGVESIHAFGTSAMRNAKNKAGFIEKIEEQFGFSVTVISGDEEARLIYKGVTLGLQTANNFVIMDIGGGSTEFIFGNQHEMTAAESFEIGAARIYQSFDLSDPVSEENCREIEAYLEKGTGNFFDDKSAHTLVGASGSFETFYELIANADFPDHQYVTISKETMLESVNQIIASTLAEREANDRIIPIRKKMAPIAAIKIRWIIRKLDIQNIMISPYSLKEGVISEIVKET